MRVSIILVVLVFFSHTLCFSETRNTVYSKVKVKNRSAIGFTNSGTAIYNYQVIDEYSNELSDEEKGNFELNGELENIREVYNHIEVNNGISNINEDVTIGTIKANSGRKVNVIENNVSVMGGVSGRMENVSIGAVQIKGTRVRRIQNTVRIRGKVDVD